MHCEYEMKEISIGRVYQLLDEIGVGFDKTSGAIKMDSFEFIRFVVLFEEELDLEFSNTIVARNIENIEEIVAILREVNVAVV